MKAIKPAFHENTQQSKNLLTKTTISEKIHSDKISYWFRGKVDS